MEFAPDSEHRDQLRHSDLQNTAQLASELDAVEFFRAETRMSVDIVPCPDRRRKLWIYDLKSGPQLTSNLVAVHFSGQTSGGRWSSRRIRDAGTKS